MSKARSRSSDADPGGPPRPVRRAVEAATYVGVVVAVAVGAASAVGIALATSHDCSALRGLNLAKILLFFGGFGLAALGSVLLARADARSPPGASRFPLRPGWLGGGHDGERDGGDDDRETAFDHLVQATPPVRFLDVPPAERLSGGAKLLASGLAVLAVTMVAEFGFGLYAVPC